eukprot:GHVN01032384.1.p1 GENE.GHVN01032384.1~~GHVN01032384.1.p1  ORF type:complete len:121 (-),score=1.45 GHVN01032384.1:179-541(-)
MVHFVSRENRSLEALDERWCLFDRTFITRSKVSTSTRCCAHIIATQPRRDQALPQETPIINPDLDFQSPRTPLIAHSKHFPNIRLTHNPMPLSFLVLSVRGRLYIPIAPNFLSQNSSRHN